MFCARSDARVQAEPQSWLTHSGNNIQFREDPPTYTNEWGFADGAQTDIFTKSSNPAGDANLINPYATGTGTVSYSSV